MTNRTDKFPPGLCRNPEEARMKRKKLAESLVRLKRWQGGMCKNGDRRFAHCALANSAGQPTENLTTDP